MLASASLAFGILLAAIILAVTRRHEPQMGGPAPKPANLGWWTLAFGMIAITAFALAVWPISIAFAFAAVLVGVGTLKRHDRHWPTWVGLGTGLAPAIAWIAFAAGNIFGLGE